MGIEVYTLFLNLSESGQRKHLKSAAVCENRTMPVHELMQSAHLVHNLVSRAQVFSLAKLRRIKEEGVYFQSHIDGKAIFMGPEESMRIQSNLGSTIAMAFDECVENPAPPD